MYGKSHIVRVGIHFTEPRIVLCVDKLGLQLDPLDAGKLRGLIQDAYKAIELRAQEQHEQEQWERE